MKYKIGDNVKVLVQGAIHIGTVMADGPVLYEINVGESVTAFLTEDDLDELNDPGNLPRWYNDGDLVVEGRVASHIDGYYLVETPDGTRLAMTRAELDCRNRFGG